MDEGIKVWDDSSDEKKDKVEILPSWDANKDVPAKDGICYLKTVVLPPLWDADKNFGIDSWNRLFENSDDLNVFNFCYVIEMNK